MVSEKGFTREDHKKVSDQLYAGYAEGVDLRGLVAIVGKDALSERDRGFLEFAEMFENRFVRQGKDEDRPSMNHWILDGICSKTFLKNNLCVLTVNLFRSIIQNTARRQSEPPWH